MKTNEFDPKYVILFDGVCNLCNSSVNFVIKHDKKNLYKFAAIQSDAGKKIVDKLNLDISTIDSVILIENDIVNIKSSAVLRISKHLNGIYPILYILLIIPPFVRNWVYDHIARNRYRWFGKQDSCMIPNEELKSKFIS